MWLYLQGLLTQSTSDCKTIELKSYSCVLLSPCICVEGNQCTMYVNVYLGFAMELTRGRLLMYINPTSVLCNLTSSSHEGKKDQRSKD